MWTRFAVYTAVLYAGLVHNAFCAQEHVLFSRGEFRSGHLTGDCALVINRLRQPDAGPWASMSSWSPAGWQPYRSQFGLTGSMFAAVQRPTGASPERVTAVGSALFGLATAAMLAAFFSSVAGRVGPVAGHVGVLLTACCPPLLAFAPAVYWSLPFTLAPFVFAWLAYGRVRPAVFLAGVGVLVCAKALNGYEYISTVVASPAAAIAFHRAAAGDRIRKWVLPVVAVGVAGVVGFAGAIGIHAEQIAAQTGESGLKVIRERAASRTAVPDGGGVEKVAYPVFAPAFLPEPVRCFVNYFYQPAVSSPQTWGRTRFVVSLGWVLAVAGAVLVVLWTRRAKNPTAAALAPAAVVGFLGAVSWQALAVNHMVFHGHLNLIVFCVPCVPLAFAGIGAGVAALGRPRLVTAGLVVLALGAMGANAVVLSRRAAERAAWDEAAVARVRGEAVVPRGGSGPEVLVMPLPIDPPFLPHPAAFWPMYAPAVPDAERPVGVYGWVRVPRERTGVQPVSVVCVRGGDVVPARVGYYRLTAVERLFGGHAACVAFHAVLPPGERPRVFVVPAEPGQPVIEMTADR